MAPKFFMMVGIAGSGKSTVASKIAANLDGCLVLSSDAIRGELYDNEAIQGDARRVFQVMEERTMEALKAGHSVIYDATNILAWRRQELLAKLPLGGREDLLVGECTRRASSSKQPDEGTSRS